MKKSLLAAFIGTAFLSATAQAGTITLNGHANFAATTILEQDDAVIDYDFNNNLDFQRDSLFGLRVNADAGNGLFAASEIMSRGQDDFRVEMKWVYVGYEVTDSTFITAGNLRLPLFNHSDFLDVGVAYTPAALPRSVYALPETYAGISAFQHFHFLNQHITVQGVLGNLSDYIEYQGNNIRIEADQIYGGNILIENGLIALRGAYYNTTDTSFAYHGDQTNIHLQQLANQELVESPGNQETRMWSFGFALRDHRLVLEADHVEFTEKNGLTPGIRATYGLFGYRMNNFTPYTMYERRRDTGATIARAGVSASAYEVIQSESLELGQSTSTWSAGVRWDFHRNAALTAEVSRLRQKNEDSGENVFGSLALSVKF